MPAAAKYGRVAAAENGEVAGRRGELRWLVAYSVLVTLALAGALMALLSERAQPVTAAPGQLAVCANVTTPVHTPTQPANSSALLTLSPTSAATSTQAATAPVTLTPTQSPTSSSPPSQPSSPSPSPSPSQPLSQPSPIDLHKQRFTSAREELLSRTNLTLFQLRRSRALVGNTFRLREFVRKLLIGDNVSLMTMGGSVTKGSQTDGSNNVYMGRCPHKWCTYGELFRMWLSRVFPPNSGSHVFNNKAMPAADQRFADMHVLEYLDQGRLKTPGGLNSTYDFVIMEYGVNDGASNVVNFNIKPMERVLRKVLQWPAPGRSHSTPALLYLCAFTVPHSTKNIIFPEHARLLRYYGVPQISTWTAFFSEFHWINTTSWPIDWSLPREQLPRLVDMWSIKEFGPGFLFAEGPHPTHLGHQLMADMLSWAVLDEMEVLLEMMQRGGLPQETKLQPFAIGRHPWQEFRPPLPTTWYTEDAQISDEKLLSRNSFVVQALGESPGGFVPSPCPSHDTLPTEWQYTSDVPDKFGWIATDSTADEHPSPICFRIKCPSFRCAVTVGYLVSYNDMGRFRMEIVDINDRVALSHVVDTLIEDRYSVMDTVRFKISLTPGQAQFNPIVRVVRQPDNSGARGVNKVKLLLLSTMDF